MTIRAKTVADHKKVVETSKESAKAEADAVAERAAAVQTVKTLTKLGEVSFAALDGDSQAELIDALVLLSGALDE